MNLLLSQNLRQARAPENAGRISESSRLFLYNRALISKTRKIFSPKCLYSRAKMKDEQIENETFRKLVSISLWFKGQISYPSHSLCGCSLFRGSCLHHLSYHQSKQHPPGKVQLLCTQGLRMYHIRFFSFSRLSQPGQQRRLT